MKKRLFSCLLALTLCLFTVPAQAAGAADYLWYVEGYGTLILSADGGGAYTELPELREEQTRTGMDYSMTTAVTPLPDGGLRVEARDRWESETSFRRDYTAAELKEYLDKAEPNPIRVLADNGAVSIGLRDVRGGGLWETDLLFSSDRGLNWEKATIPEGAAVDKRMLGMWDEEAFWLAPGACYLAAWEGQSATLRSADGLVWEAVDPAEADTPSPRKYTARLGGYHFVMDSQGGVWLRSRENAARLHKLVEFGAQVTEEGEARYSPGGLTAYWTPRGEIALSVYDSQNPFESASACYFPAELETALGLLETRGEYESLPITRSRTVGGVTLGWAGGEGEWPDGVVVRSTDGGENWQLADNALWSGKLVFLPFDGRNFLLRDGGVKAGFLYASPDGLTWTGVSELRPPEVGEDCNGCVDYAMTWAGTEYMACRKGWEARHGMMGMSGGGWYEGNTRIFFLDENFHITDTYDFGRLVEVVGYCDGMYYAKISNSAGTRDGWSGEDVYDATLGSQIYASHDKVNWAEEDTVFRVVDTLAYQYDGGRYGAIPYAAPEARPRASGPSGTADWNGYHFLLSSGWGGEAGIMVLDERGVGGVLPGTPEAIKAKWIVPKYLTAAPDGKGNVTLCVQDVFTPSMTCSVTVSPAQLDVTVAGGTGGWDWYRIDPESATDDGKTCLALNRLTQGESELIWAQYGGDGEHTISFSSGDISFTTGFFSRVPDVPWGGYIILCPYNGKTFQVFDRESGKFYSSADGRTWTELNKDWAQAGPYSFLWTGDNYLATGETDTKILFLDENFDLLGDYDFGRRVEAVGCLESRIYAQTAEEDESVLRVSADGGETFQATDLLEIYNALRLRE